MKRGRMSASMKWRCLGHLQPLSKAKHFTTAMAKKEVCPRDEIADPPGMAVLPIDIHGFDAGLVSFCYEPLERFIGIMEPRQDNGKQQRHPSP